MTKRELAGERVFVIEDFFTPDECAAHIARAEAGGFDEAPITTGAGFVMMKDVRNNSRVMIDDSALAADLWPRLQPHLPARVGFYEPSGLNERWRWYRYDRGEKFAPHFDGYFQRPDGTEVSRLTFMVYLNDGFEGGATIFHDYEPRIVVQPVRGMALVFVHRQLHEGAPIVAGRKYVLRSDVMCRYCPPEPAAQPLSNDEEDALSFQQRNSLIRERRG